MVIYRAITEIN